MVEGEVSYSYKSIGNNIAIYIPLVVKYNKCLLFF